MKQESPEQVVMAAIAEEGLGSRSRQMMMMMMMRRMRRRTRRTRRRVKRRTRRRLRDERQGWQTEGLSWS